MDAGIARAAHALVSVRLDPSQREAVAAPSERPLLVLGEAGHGKTTVLLHRLARLARKARRGGARFRGLLLVPSPGLAELLARAVLLLGVSAPGVTVRVLSFDGFARRQALRAFPSMPRRASRDATAATARLKRDPALLAALERLAAGPPRALNDDPDDPRENLSAHVSLGDLQHLFGDRAILETLVAASEGRVPHHAIEETLAHTRVLFSPRAEEAWAHVTDRRRLETLDGRPLDAGTPDADATTLDPEDYPVLFALDALRASQRRAVPRSPRRYDFVALDEAQEFAPLELALTGRALAPGGALTVAGDAHQQLDESAAFGGFRQTMTALGASSYSEIVLPIGYRCAPAVAALARWVLGRGPVGADASPPPVQFALEGQPGGSMVPLADHVAKLTRRQPEATVAVIVRSPRRARWIAGRLRTLGQPVRAPLDGSFRFTPGVEVTTVDQARGLEFDHVVVADASRAEYPDDEPSRRALYVAITRARKSVFFVAEGALTAALGPHETPG